jgi:predicted DNA-binding transcriptional regulator YafY
LLPPDCSEDAIAAVHSALLSEQQLEINYTYRENSETKTYPVHPLGLVQRGAVTYLIVTMYDYADIRMLALHRIKNAKVLDLPSKIPDGFNLAQYVNQGALGFEENGLIKLIVRFTCAAAEHLWETPLSLDQEIKPDTSGWVRLQATVPDTAQLRWWLRGFGSEVEVLEPTAIREEFALLSASMNNIYCP